MANAPDADRAARYYGVLDEWLDSSRVIERDPLAEGVVQKELEYAPTPASYAHRFVTNGRGEPVFG